MLMRSATSPATATAAAAASSSIPLRVRAIDRSSQGHARTGAQLQVSDRAVAAQTGNIVVASVLAAVREHRLDHGRMAMAAGLLGDGAAPRRDPDRLGERPGREVARMPEAV